MAWRRVQVAERLCAGSSWEGGGHVFVFTTETGRLLDQRKASRAYARALKRAGPRAVPARFHIIRHSVASMMLVDGAVSVRTASEVFGHATTAITADIYGHVAQQANADGLGGRPGLSCKAGPPTPPESAAEHPESPQTATNTATRYVRGPVTTPVTGPLTCWYAPPVGLEPTTLRLTAECSAS